MFDLRAKGESAVQYLHQSWQKPKEEVHRYWRRHGVVSAPNLEFFLQSFAEVEAGSALIQAQAPSGLVQQEIADEGLAATAKPQGQQGVQQVQVQAEDTDMAERCVEDESISTLVAVAEQFDVASFFHSRSML